MWLMIFLLALGWFLYQVYKTSADGSAENPPNPSNYPCDNPPPGKTAGHKWVLKFPDGRSDHRGYLICKKCGHMPGEL